jgi:hypothetical protein
MSAGGGLRPALPSTRTRAACDRGFGIDRKTPDVCGGIRLMVEVGYRGKDRVSLREVFER